MSDDRFSVRDEYERDEQGKVKGDKKSNKKPSKIKEKMKGKFKRKGNNGGGFTNIILVIIIIVGIIFVAKNTDIIDVRKWNVTQEEGMTSIFNQLEKLNFNMKSKEYDNDFYDKNRLYNDAYVKKQEDKEYLVYVYTHNKDKNEDYDDWVKENSSNVKIYKLNIDDIDTDKEIREYKEDKEPMVLLYNEVDRGEKELDGVIKDADLLDDTLDRIEELKQKKEKEKEELKEKRAKESKKNKD